MLRWALRNGAANTWAATPGPAPRCPRAMPCSGLLLLSVPPQSSQNHPGTELRPLPVSTPGPPGPSLGTSGHTRATCHPCCCPAPRWHPSHATQDVPGRSRSLHCLEPLRKNLSPQRLGVLPSTTLNTSPVLFISHSPAGGNSSGLCGHGRSSNSSDSSGCARHLPGEGTAARPPYRLLRPRWAQGNNRAPHKTSVPDHNSLTRGHQDKRRRHRGSGALPGPGRGCQGCPCPVQGSCPWSPPQ